MSKSLVEQLRSCARGIGLNLVDQAADRIEELEAQLAEALKREATDYNEAVDEIARLVDRRPVERSALALSIAELDQLANSDEGELTPSQAESMLLVLHELSRLQAAPQGDSK